MTTLQPAARPTRQLRSEHDGLLPYIETLRLIAENVQDAAPAALATRIEQAVEYLRTCILPHIRAEESVVYPVVERLMGAPAATATMRHDHVEIALLTDELEQAGRDLAAASPSARTRNALYLTLYGLYTLLLTHIAKEDQVYLPLIDARLPAQEVEQLAEQLRTVEVHDANPGERRTQHPHDAASDRDTHRGRFILVPLDGSVAGEDALPYAEVIARAKRLPLHLFSVIPIGPITVRAGRRHAPGWLDLPARRAREHYLQTVAGKIAHEGLAASTEVVCGEAVDEILRVTHQGCVELVALSSHGRGGVERLLLGSVADKVMRLSPVPVLIARRTEAGAAHSLRTLQRVAVPLDGSAAAEAAIPVAARLVQDRGSLVLVRVAPSAEALYDHDKDNSEAVGMEKEWRDAALTYLEQVRSLVSPAVRVQTAVLCGPVAPTLQQWVEAQAIDLVVMTSHGLGGWRRLLVGSVAERLLRLGVPALLVRPPAERGGSAAIATARSEASVLSV